MSRFHIVRFLGLVALLCLTAVPARADGIPRISEITEITIHLSAGNWAFSDSSDETIRRGGGAFVRSDAVVLRDADVQKLLDALAAPAASTVSPARTGFDRAYLQAHLDDAEGFLGAAVSIPAARAKFDSLFLDSAAMQQWFVQASYPTAVLPKKPVAGGPQNLRVIGRTTSPRIDYKAEVTIVAPRERITVTTSSPNAFMLPFTIGDGRTERRSWDPAISRAIVSLLPDGAILSRHLTASNAYIEWARAVANTQSVSTAIERDAVDAQGAARIAKAAGLSIEYDVGKDPARWRTPDDYTYDPRVTPFAGIDSAASWTGWAGDPGLPAVKFTMGGIRSSALELEMLLKPVSAAFRAIRLAKWIPAALAANPGATAEMRTIDRTTLNNYVWALQILDKPRAAQVLEQNLASAVSVEFNRGSPGSSTWLLLQNGETILLDFDDGATFAFGAKWYRALPRRTTKSDYGVAGVLVDPDGKLDLSPYKAPVPIM